MRANHFGLEKMHIVTKKWQLDHLEAVSETKNCGKTWNLPQKSLGCIQSCPKMLRFAAKPFGEHFGLISCS